MVASLTWIDHDADARERSLRILSLFQEKESRDELGLGGIRDSFADQLFPGTSTIQTRLRYMLFVAWIYQSLEGEGLTAADFARRADKAERDLIDVMRSADDRETGIFGGRSGRRLKRLPSSVYWAGLGAWQLRRAGQSQDQYHRSIPHVVHLRAAQVQRDAERRRNGDDSDHAPDPKTLTWHPRLPTPPTDFPNAANFRLRKEDALFLRDQLTHSHPHSLLTHLALHCQPTRVEAPWHHPEYATFTDDHRELLDHARRFSEVAHGAALLYNLALAETRGWTAKAAEHSASLTTWLAALNYADLCSWSLEQLWTLTRSEAHVIKPPTRSFVEQWVRAVVAQRAKLVTNGEVRELVRARERALKKARSRFTNRRALDQWGGSSGLAHMTYRWPTARTFLQELHDGLNPGSP